MKLDTINSDSTNSVKDVNDFDDYDNDSKFDDNFMDEDYSQDFGFGNDQAPIDKYQDLLKKLTNFQPFLRNMITEWLGLVWSATDGKYINDPDPKTKPIMNYYGAKWCINFLTPYTRENNILTSLDRESYKAVIEDVIDTAILNVGCRSEEFGITEDGDCLKIWNQLIHSVLLILVGAKDTNNYKQLLKETVHRSENVNLSEAYNQRLKPKGFINNLKNKFMGE